jgi:hypothetical protein
MSLAIPEPVEGVALCDQRASYCRCREAAGHDGPHACPCGGAWTGDIDGGDFKIVDFPLTGRPIAPIPGLAADEDW